MKIRCKHCGEFFCPSDESVDLISEGGISGSLMDVRMIYQYAMKGNASGIIIAHYVKKIYMLSGVCYLYK